MADSLAPRGRFGPQLKGLPQSKLQDLNMQLQVYQKTTQRVQKKPSDKNRQKHVYQVKCHVLKSCKHEITTINSIIWKLQVA